jgi:hypothetical protein
MAVLTREQWQFKFFDVAQVKLPDDEGSFLSEVPMTMTASQADARMLTQRRSGTLPR